MKLLVSNLLDEYIYMIYVNRKNIYIYILYLVMQ